jgi:hypothetical protein
MEVEVGKLNGILQRYGILTKSGHAGKKEKQKRYCAHWNFMPLNK